MLVQNNLVAFRSAIFYKKPETDVNKAEQLASGHSINRIADDAAALEVSDRMRRQISGLNRESAEVQNSISLAQVAEEGLNKAGEILQRINSLSVKAVDDDITVAERNSINNKIRDLLGELDKIARETSFDQKLYPLLGENGYSDEPIFEAASNDENISEEPFSKIPIKFLDATSKGFDLEAIDVSTSEDAAFYNMKVENALNTTGTYKSVLGIVRSRLENSIGMRSNAQTADKIVISDESTEAPISNINDSLTNILKYSEQAMMAQRSKDGNDVLVLLNA